MSKIITPQKYCYCQISTNKEILKSNVNNSFCEICGSIILKSSNGTIYYPIHAKQKTVFNELNPIDIIKSMKKKTDKEYPYIYNLYNMPKDQDDAKSNQSMRSINMYLRHRKKLILKLQKLMKTFDYCDIIFYQTLFFLDTYLSHDITIEMSEKAILYFLVGYFLCAIKLKETDVYEPSLDSFLDLEKGIYLSPGKIAFYEVICMKRIKYNIFSYSSYDWLRQLMSIGYVFNTEVDSTNEIILVKGHRHSLVNTINKLAIKLLLNLTNKDIFFKYSPIYIALSIIQYSREKYIKKNMIKPKLFFNFIEILGINYNDYQECYEEIKKEINEDIKINAKDKKENDNIKDTKEKNDENNIKRSSVDKIGKNFLSGNKNIYVPNKLRSSNGVININQELLLKEIKEEKNKDEENNPKNRRNHKSIRKNHLSIDCSSSAIKSNDTLPLINGNIQVENKLKPINLKSAKFIVNLEKEEQKQNKSNNKLEEINTINIKVINKKKLQSTNKLPRLNLEDILNKKNNNKTLEPNKDFNDNIDKVKKHFRLKTNNNA